MKDKKVSRKKLAEIISEDRGHDVSVDQVRKNEKRWGLIPAKADFNGRAFYKEAEAMAALRKSLVIKQSR